MQTAVVYGDGPHVASLTVVLLAVLATYRALQKPTPRRIGIASVVTALVVLINLPGGIVFAFGFVALAVAYGDRRTALRNAKVLAGIAVFGYALSAHWFPLSTIATIFRNTEAMEPGSAMQMPPALSLALLVSGYACLRGSGSILRVRRDVIFWACWSWPLGLILVCAGWFHRTLIAQPLRFHVGFEIAVIPLILSLVPGGVHWAESVSVIHTRRRLTEHMVFCAIGVLAIIQVWRYHNFAIRLVQPIRISETSEFQMSQAIQKYAPGERVMVPGSISFWLNAFIDNPQVNGCCTQGNISAMASIAQFEFFTDALAGGRAAEISELWLTAVGATVVGVSGPGSTEKYKTVRNFKKFGGRLPLLWSHDGDSLYRLPVRYHRIVHSVPESSLVSRTPLNGIDVDPLRAYALALKTEPPGVEDVRWESENTFTFTSTSMTGNVLSIQIPYHAGWRATVNGEEFPITMDGLGFMVIHSSSQLRVPVKLTFAGNAGSGFVDAVNLVAAILLVGLGLFYKSHFVTRGLFV